MLLSILYCMGIYMLWQKLILIIKMEESLIIETICIFLSSHQLDEVSIQVFTPTDQLVATLIIKNYTKGTFYLQKHIPHFYCLISNSLTEDEQFEVKVPDNDDGRLQICKDFTAFSIKMEIQISRDVKNIKVARADQQEQKIVQLARQHLKKIERRIFKRIQLQKLRQPLREKGNIKKTSIRKARTNININWIVKGSETSIIQKNTDPSKTMGNFKTFLQFKLSEESESSQQIYESKRHGKKCNTLRQRLYRKSDLVSKANCINKAEEKIEGPKSIYQEMCESLLPSTRRVAAAYKPTHKSYISSLEAQTWKQLDSQKIALRLIQQMDLKTPENSRVRVGKKTKLCQTQKQMRSFQMACKVLKRKRVGK